MRKKQDSTCEQKRPTPELKYLSLTQNVLGKPIPKGLVQIKGMTAWTDLLLEYSMFHLMFVNWTVRISISDRLSSNFHTVNTNGSVDFGLSLLTSSDQSN